MGNVYEPFLALTHHLDVLHHRLLQGYTIGEASLMALPALSWQAVLLGDPLYRPFQTDLRVDLNERADRDYKALRHALFIVQAHEYGLRAPHPPAPGASL